MKLRTTEVLTGSTLGRWGNWLDRWGKWLTLLLTGLIAILLEYEKIFDLNEGNRWKIYIAIVTLTALSLACHFGLDRLRPRIKKLEEEIKQQQEIIDEVANLTFALFDGLMLNLSKKLRIFDDHKSRVTLYVHDPSNHHFIPCGRYSADPEFKKLRGRKYPDNQGCIAGGWRRGWFFKNDFPKTRTAHQKCCKKEFGILKKTHEQIRMLSVLICAMKLSSGSDPIAVIVVESLNKSTFKEAGLKKELQSVSDDYAKTLSVFKDHILESHTSKGVET